MNVLWDYLCERMAKHQEQKLCDAGRMITYSELIKKAIDLSKTLVRDRKYGILCDSELNTAIGILACFSANAVAVPLSKRYGENHINAIIESIRLSHKITDNNRTLQTEQFREEIPETDDLTDSAVILCTSGTMGKPKGVKLSYQNLLANIKSIQAYFKLTSDDRILIQRSLFHASAITGEFLTALIAGANIHFFGNTTLPLAAARYISDRKITVLGTTPTLASYLVHKALPLRKLAVSGECLSQSAAQKLIEALPNTMLYNAYGLTEASPRVSVLMPEDFAKYPQSVGKAIQGVECKIQDGELLVRGANVMQGYYNNPVETAKKLQDGWLRTGDSASIDEQGFIAIYGRLDDMIIRAGMNIYPQEIENAIRASSNVHDVIAYENDSNICVKVVAHGVSKQELIALCHANLPSYAIPAQIEFADEIPKNATGKLVRYG